MPGYPQNTVKLVVGGRIGGDIWRTTIDCSAVVPSPPGGPEMNDLMAALKPKFDTWWTTHKATVSSVVTYESLQGYYFAETDTTARAVGTISVTPVAGTGSSPLLPLRTAMVCTKVTDYAGRHNRGRAYLPVNVSGLVGGGSDFPTAQIQTVANAYAGLLLGIQTATLPGSFTDLTPIVTSVTAPVPGQVITSVKVDSLPDSQRRRTNADVPAATYSSHV